MLVYLLAWLFFDAHRAEEASTYLNAEDGEIFRVCNIFLNVTSSIYDICLSWLDFKLWFYLAGLGHLRCRDRYHL